MFFKIGASKHFANSTEKPQILRLPTLLKRDLNTGTLPRNQQHFQELLYSQNISSGYYRRQQQQDNSKNNIHNNLTRAIPQEFSKIISTQSIFNISYMKNSDWITLFKRFNVCTVVVKRRRINFSCIPRLMTFIGELLVFV